MRDCKTPLKQLITKKVNNPKIRFNSQQIILCCLGQLTQNPGLREVELEWLRDKYVIKSF